MHRNLSFLAGYDGLLYSYYNINYSRLTHPTLMLKIPRSNLCIYCRLLRVDNDKKLDYFSNLFPRNDLKIC